MAWTATPTFVDGVVLTYSQLNILARDLDETATGKATTAGGYYVGSAPNALVERQIQSNFVVTSDTTTSTTYDDLSATSGPTLTVTTGPGAMAFYGSLASNNTVNAGSITTCELTGATSYAPGLAAAVNNTSSTANAGLEASCAVYFSLTSGSNIFTLKYRVTTGTGTFSNRRLVVMPF